MTGPKSHRQLEAEPELDSSQNTEKKEKGNENVHVCIRWFEKLEDIKPLK